MARAPIWREENLMKVHVPQQAQESLGTSALMIMSERVDEVALLIGQMVKMGFVAVLHRPLPRPWKPRGRSWGWTAVIGLASILTEREHRKGAVEAYIKGMPHPLRQLRGQAIEPLAFRDDR
jgi:hypothetical protein